MLALWYNIRQRFKAILEEEDARKRVDKGLLYLSASMFVWVASGCWAYIGTGLNWDHTLYYKVGETMFSLVNNLFMALALFYFYYAPGFIYSNERNISKIIAAIVLTALATFALTLFQPENSHYWIVGIPDLIISAFLCVLLVVSFYKAFVSNHLHVVAVISIIVLTLMFASQLPQVFLSLDNRFVNTLLKLVSKTSLIALFLLLATNWVIRLALAPRPAEMKIRFMDWSLVRISIPSKDVNDVVIDFGSKTTQYRNLLKFAIRRKHGDAQTQSILIGMGGEITNQTYLSRIIDNMNQVLRLDKESKLERRDLFTFIGESRYRLRMVPENIVIDPALLGEFINTPENKEYKALCNGL